MNELVETIVTALVDAPESVQVKETAGDSIIILEIQSSGIGSNIESLLTKDLYLYYVIDESKGLEKVDVLGKEADNNYLLCPKSKVNLITNLIKNS